MHTRVTFFMTAATATRQTNVRPHAFHEASRGIQGLAYSTVRNAHYIAYTTRTQNAQRVAKACEKIKAPRQVRRYLPAMTPLPRLASRTLLHRLLSKGLPWS